jgi:hypothetical protein
MLGALFFIQIAWQNSETKRLASKLRFTAFVQPHSGNLMATATLATQAADGTIHVVYSYFVTGGKSMKHAAFNEAWVKQSESQ